MLGAVKLRVRDGSRPRYVAVAMSDATVRPDFAQVLRITGRALRRRCPNCGGGGVWTSWLKMREACPTCGLHFERGEHGFVPRTYAVDTEERPPMTGISEYAHRRVA